jgi:hypothetical protein
MNTDHNRSETAQRGHSKSEGFVISLTEQTGISAEQARNLIELLGHDRSSLMREARELKKFAG